MPAIEVSHLTKEYRLGALLGLKQTLLNAGARLAGQKVLERPLFKALDDVSFSIEPGEVVGIIGHNGAGKSTLLKMLARISTPTRGSVKVNGRIAPLIEVGAGFVPEFTGRENVYLNGSILGMPKKEIDRKFDEIVDFAEMAEFIDTPVKRYSSGMQVKLAFAVATSIESEILIVDEVLAVGDLAFQRKCFDRMERLIKREKRTVLLVSHNIRQVERLCSRVLMMDRGHVLNDGDAADVCNRFYEQSDERVLMTNSAASATDRWRSLQSSGEIDLERITLHGLDGRAIHEVAYLGDFLIRLQFRAHKLVKQPVFGIGLHTTDFIYLATNHIDHKSSRAVLDSGLHTFECVIRSLPLLPRTYAIRVGISVGEQRDTAFYVENALMFRVVGADLNRTSPDSSEGFIALETEWRSPQPNGVQSGIQKTSA